MWMRHPVPTPDRRNRRSRSSRPLLESLCRAVLAAITITTAADAGPGSLRDAIERANQDPAPDEIDFAPSVTGTIRLTSALPELTGALAVRGPGSASLKVSTPCRASPSSASSPWPRSANVEFAGLNISGGMASGTDGGGGILNGQRHADDHRLHHQRQLGQWRWSPHRWRRRYP